MHYLVEGSITPRDFAQFMWAHAFLNLSPPPEVVEGLEIRMMALLDGGASFPYKSTTMMLWAYNALELWETSPLLLRQLTMRVEQGSAGLQPDGTWKHPCNKRLMANSFSFGSLHVRCTPMGRTCGGPNELKTTPTLKITFPLFFKVHG